MPLMLLFDLAQTAALIVLACYVANLYGRAERAPRREGGYKPPPHPWSVPYGLPTPPPPPPEPARRSRR